MSDNLFLHRQLRAAGLSRRWIRRALGIKVVARACRGVYARGPADGFRDLRALFARLPPGTALGFETAAALYGFLPTSADPVHVIVPSGSVRPRIQGVLCHEAIVAVESPIIMGGVPVAPPARCAIDLARTATRPTGLAILDAALRVHACAPADLAAEVGLHGGLRGVRRARELVEIADGRAECAQESHLRLVIIDGGLPAPEPQVWVHDSTGRRAYRIDLAYRKRKIGLEYDGRSHLSLDRLNADRSRMNWLSGRGWAMRYFTARDVYQSPALVVAEVRALLR
jgi:hypothetical protein